jgi:hypothetical protein
MPDWLTDNGMVFRLLPSSFATLRFTFAELLAL